MKLLETIFGYLLILLTTFWVIGFIIFSAYSISIKYQTLTHADAIITLTGGSDRIKESVRLLQEQKAERLFISGVDENVSGDHFLKEILPQQQEKIELGRWAKTTHMNAIETTEWVRENKITSVILVTSFYHMPRSLLEIKRALPDIEITPYAVFPQNFGKNTDWIHTRYAWQLFLEYHKFLIVYFCKGVVK